MKLKYYRHFYLNQNKFTVTIGQVTLSFWEFNNVFKIYKPGECTAPQFSYVSKNRRYKYPY